MLPSGEEEYFIDEHQVQAIHDYIDDERNGIDSFFKRCYIFYEMTGVRAYCRISKTLLKIKRALEFDTNRKITLKSFRHHYGIKRVYITGNIFQVAMEMGHKNVTTTQLYLRFQPDEIKQHFPSLIPIIESMENIPKNGTRATKTRATYNSSVNKLQRLTR